MRRREAFSWFLGRRRAKGEGGSFNFPNEFGEYFLHCINFSSRFQNIKQKSFSLVHLTTARTILNQPRRVFVYFIFYFPLDTCL